MPRTVLLVPRGAEAAAVRRGAAGACVVELPAGAGAAAALPPLDEKATVVVLGLCGALRGLHVGDVVIYARIVDAARTVALDALLIERLRAVLPGAAVVNASTADRVVTTAAARIVLAQKFDADVVDMEAAHLAFALASRGVRFGMVRVVSDDASRDLPPLGDAVDEAGRVSLLRIALAFARTPCAALAFVRNVRRALATLRQTARAAKAVQ